LLALADGTLAGHKQRMRRDYSIPRGELHRVPHTSRVLESNPLGDPVSREVHVWTPPGWSAAEKLPLLVDLTGYWGAGPSHTNWKNYGESVPERLDRLAHEGMARVVVAFPDCFTKLYGNQYLNSEGSGRYADYLCEEIVPFVEEKFGCGGRGKRGVFGKSSGGYGAAWHALERADFWSAAAMNSADMGFEAMFVPTFFDDVLTLRKYDYSIEKYIRDIESKPKLSPGDFNTLLNLAMSAFFDPTPGAFRAMSLPYDPYTMQLIPERWANWMKHDPVEMLDTRLDEIRKLKLIYMDCGWSDQFRIHFGMRRFAAKLTAAGIAHTYKEFDDDHTDVDYRMDVFLPLMAKALS